MHPRAQMRAALARTVVKTAGLKQILNISVRANRGKTNSTIPGCANSSQARVEFVIISAGKRESGHHSIHHSLRLSLRGECLRDVIN